MSDSNTYFNAFVDAAVGSIHEYVALTLQLKAKLKLANDLLAEQDNSSDRLEQLRSEKDAVISELTEQLTRQAEQLRSEKDFVATDLTRQLENLRTDKSNSYVALQNELNVVRNQLNESNAKLNEAKLIEESFHGMKNKIQHMDTLTKQYSDLKNQYASLIEQHNLDKAKLEKFMSDSEMKPSKKVINTKVKQKETKDDF
jgi:DNA repair exonuclease SbcCD ATPase subunit